jgi:urease accessory protein UreE
MIKQTVLYPYKGEILISLENHELKINVGDVLIINEASTIKVESESSDLIWIEIF